MSRMQHSKSAQYVIFPNIDPFSLFDKISDCSRPFIINGGSGNIDYFEAFLFHIISYHSLVTLHIG